MKTITIKDNATTFQVILLEGMEPEALNKAVATRSGHADFFLTLGSEQTDPVVPLSASLPDGMVLHLQVVSRDEPNAASANGAVENDTASSNHDEETPPTSSSRPSGRSQGEKKKKTWLEKLRIIESDISIHHHHHQDHLWDHVLYVNQLGSDLANERTMLAWTRTMLAALRTAFTYMRYDAVQSSSLTAALMIMATLMLLSGLNAAGRYYQIRRVLKDKPKTYGRVALGPYILLAVVAVILNSVGVYSGKWTA